jgi:hypothetical protein
VVDQRDAGPQPDKLAQVLGRLPRGLAHVGRQTPVLRHIGGFQQLQSQHGRPGGLDQFGVAVKQRQGVLCPHVVLASRLAFLDRKGQPSNMTRS